MIKILVYSYIIYIFELLLFHIIVNYKYLQFLNLSGGFFISIILFIFVGYLSNNTNPYVSR